MTTAGAIDLPIEHALKVWAAQKRRIWLGRSAGQEVDGWSLQSVLARIKDEREGAGHSRPGQKFAEVFTGDGLLVQRLQADLSEEPRAVLNVHYIFVGDQNISLRERVEALGISRALYWNRLASAREAISLGLRVLWRLDTLDFDTEVV